MPDNSTHPTSVRQLVALMGGVGAIVVPAVWLLVTRQVGTASLSPTGLLAGTWVLAGFAVVVAVMMSAFAAMVRGLRAEVDRQRVELLHDPLTKLVNRAVFEDRLGQRVRERRRRSEQGALIIVDLDRFKQLNESLGRASCDQLLVEIAQRLSSRLRTSDTVARLGGDEFGVLLPVVDGLEGVTKVVESIRRLVAQPYTVHGRSVTLNVTVGVAMLDDQVYDVPTIMNRAHRALQQAVRDNSGYAIYDPDRTVDIADEQELIADLRRGIARGELRLFYQPKARISSRKIRSMEALVRWEHPKRGLLSPDTFIPLAERNGLMRHLTYWVLDEAMRQVRQWADRGTRFRVAVNLSQHSLLDETMPLEIARVLERHGVPARALEIEITESALVDDIRAANAALTKLADMGVALSIDDYGTGHSSLAHVRGLPVTCIKIDRSFVSGMLENPTDAAIVRSTVELASQIGIGVVAEGVETMEEWEALSALGCGVAQGYLISKPRPGDEIGPWLEAIGYRFRMDAGSEAALPLPEFAVT